MRQGDRYLPIENTYLFILLCVCVCHKIVICAFTRDDESVEICMRYPLLLDTHTHTQQKPFISGTSNCKIKIKMIRLSFLIKCLLPIKFREYLSLLSQDDVRRSKKYRYAELTPPWQKRPQN